MSEYNAVSAKRRFRPRLLPTIATVVLLPVLASLGVWQLERADEKRERIARFDTGTQIERLDSMTSVRGLAELTQFQRVQLDVAARRHHSRDVFETHVLPILC